MYSGNLYSLALLAIFLQSLRVVLIFGSRSAALLCSGASSCPRTTAYPVLTSLLGFPTRRSSAPHPVAHLSEFSKYSNIPVDRSSSPNSHPVNLVFKLISLLHFTQQSFSFPSSVSQDLDFVQLLDVVPPRDIIDGTLNCICLRWATNYDNTADSVFISTHSDSDIPSPWFSLIPISSILGSVHVLCQNYFGSPFPSSLQWRLHQFYLSRFYRHPAEKSHVPTSK